MASDKSRGRFINLGGCIEFEEGGFPPGNTCFYEIALSVFSYFIVFFVLAPVSILVAEAIFAWNRRRGD